MAGLLSRVELSEQCREDLPRRVFEMSESCVGRVPMQTQQMGTVLETHVGPRFDAVQQSTQHETKQKVSECSRGRRATDIGHAC